MELTERHCYKMWGLPGLTTILAGLRQTRCPDTTHRAMHTLCPSLSSVIIADNHVAPGCRKTLPHLKSLHASARCMCWTHACATQCSGLIQGPQHARNVVCTTRREETHQMECHGIKQDVCPEQASSHIQYISMSLLVGVVSSSARSLDSVLGSCLE